MAPYRRRFTLSTRRLWRTEQPGSAGGLLLWQRISLAIQSETVGWLAAQVSRGLFPCSWLDGVWPSSHRLLSTFPQHRVAWQLICNLQLNLHPAAPVTWKQPARTALRLRLSRPLYAQATRLSQVLIQVCLETGLWADSAVTPQWRKCPVFLLDVLV